LNSLNAFQPSSLFARSTSPLESFSASYSPPASEGLWKTKNGGTKFEDVFKDQIQAIGDVCIDQNNPDTVWVGTGETWTRNSTTVGNGVYVTYDGGKNWKHKGLDDTERIGNIIINPENTNVVYVAALGPLWSDSEDRGVYKTTDGGKSWEKGWMRLSYSKNWKVLIFIRQLQLPLLH